MKLHFVSDPVRKNGNETFLNKIFVKTNHNVGLKNIFSLGYLSIPRRELMENMRIIKYYCYYGGRYRIMKVCVRIDNFNYLHVRKMEVNRVVLTTQLLDSERLHSIIIFFITVYLIKLFENPLI